MVRNSWELAVVVVVSVPSSSSGAVEGDCGGTAFPQIFFRENDVPSNRNGARENVEAVFRLF